MTTSLRIGTLIVITLVLTGCDGAQSTSGLQSAVDAYDQGRFNDARSAATTVMLSTSGATRDDAAYVAGLAAYRLGDLDEADRRLSVAADSHIAETAARSQAMLGMVRLRQNRPGEAAPLLHTAASDLSGADRVNAERLAADARARAGDYQLAEKHYRHATTTAARRTTSEIGSRSGFALQVGAFHQESRARDAAYDARNVATTYQLAPPRVIPEVDARGRKLYLVQMGNFSSRHAADRARHALGRLDLIVASRAN